MPNGRGGYTKVLSASDLLKLRLKGKRAVLAACCAACAAHARSTACLALAGGALSDHIDAADTQAVLVLVQHDQDGPSSSAPAGGAEERFWVVGVWRPPPKGPSGKQQVGGQGKGCNARGAPTSGHDAERSPYPSTHAAAEPASRLACCGGRAGPAHW